MAGSSFPFDDAAFSRPTSSLFSGGHDNEFTVYLDDVTADELRAFRRQHQYKSYSDAVRACLQIALLGEDYAKRVAAHEASLVQKRIEAIADNLRRTAAEREDEA